MPHPLEESPSPRRRARNRGQRGNTLVVALIALTGLATLGALTVSSVQGGVTSTTSESAHQIALYAAESGVMVGMRYLNEPVYDYSPPERFSNIVRPAGVTEVLPGLPGNRRLPGHSENVFSPSMKAWYDVEVRNNPTDPGFANPAPGPPGWDQDGRIIFTSIGHGPGNATATVEVEVQFDDAKDQYVILSWREVE